MTGLNFPSKRSERYQHRCSYQKIEEQRKLREKRAEKRNLLRNEVEQEVQNEINNIHNLRNKMKPNVLLANCYFNIF